MALGDGSNWDETNPQQTTLANQEDSYNRDLRVGVRVRMAQEHIWPSSQTGSAQAGPHAFITFQPQTSAPALPIVNSVTQAGAIYFQTNNCYIVDSAGTARLVFQSGAGLAISATSTVGGVVTITGSGALGILTPATTNGQMLISSSGASPLWADGLDTRTTGLSVGTVYQATNAGFVYIAGYVQAGSPSTITLLSDTSNPPTTKVGELYSNDSVGGNQIGGTINYPIIRGEYFKVTTGGTISIQVYSSHPLK